MLLRDANTKIRRVILATATLAACVASGYPATAYAAAGHTDVTISTAPTHDMALNNGVYSPTGANATLNVNDLTNALNSGSLEVTTGKLAGDIDIEAAFHWVSGYALTLEAFHSIRVNQPVTDAGTGALTLTTNDGGVNGHLEFAASGNITFWSLANTLTINGKPYTLVNSIASLAAAVTANSAGNYALAASYDASIDHTYKQDPVASAFAGNFDGLGNAISNVSMRFTGGNIGFFNTIGSGASVSNFRLRNITIFVTVGQVGAVGGLAGASDGMLYGDEVSGTITAQNGGYLGGLIGMGSGSIARCSSDVTLKGGRFGGVYGEGGLAGVFAGTIVDSSAAGHVRGGGSSMEVGGLVGVSTGLIGHSHAAADVSALYDTIDLGGLVGVAYGPIVDSYATGNVKVGVFVQSAGGLVGSTHASITRSFASGKVDSDSEEFSGGLAGGLWAGSSITNSYATGAITAGRGTSDGGLIGPGNMSAFISNSYATGNVTTGNKNGGFGCGLIASQVSNDYWNTTTSGTTYGECQNTNIAGVTGLTTTQLQSGLPAGFDPKVWAQDRRINRGFHI